MIINKIQIENFGCYYEKNEFNLSKGLNLILAGNGEGKTIFYKAVEWLFEGEFTDKMLDGLKCAKKFAEIESGKSFKVRVTIYLNWLDEEYIINRSFIVTKTSSIESSIKGNSLEIKVKRKNGELDIIDVPQRYLDNQIFPTAIREYSMFEGESNLDIFKKDESLIILINLFSNAKKYDNYSKKAAFLAKKAEDELASKARQNDAKKRRYKSLESEIEFLKRDIEKLEINIKNSDKEIFNYNKQVDQLTKEAHNSENVVINQTRIKGYQDKIDHLYSDIKDNYTESLFDQFWILQNFNNYYDKFSKIISKASKDRSKAEKEFYVQEGLKRIGIIGGKTPLPVYVPNKEVMQQLLDEEICKVCNREAKEGSDAYKFMKEKLDELIKSEAGDIDSKELFISDTVRGLDILKSTHDKDKRSFNRIKDDIKDTIEFNEARKSEIEKNQKKINELEDEIEKWVGKSNFTSESAASSFNNLKNLTNLIKEEEFDNSRFLDKLKLKEDELSEKQTLKDEMDNESGSISEQETRDILRDISKIFDDTKINKFDKFIDKIENVSNKFLQQINMDSFTGEVKFQRNLSRLSNSVKLELHVKDRLFSAPNQSLLTSVYISILFSISELSNESREEYFPLIFDAPTSTFDQKKISQFLNSIYNTPTQKIIVTKDFVVENKNKSGGVLEISNEFNEVKRDKALWVRLKRPFDRKDQSTLQTEISELK
jgi:DNA sulfur modification protein DndD